MARTPVAAIHSWDTYDTWWDIAYRYTGSGLNWYALARANPQITNPNRVPVGTRVMIPKGLIS